MQKPETLEKSALNHLFLWVPYVARSSIDSWLKNLGVHMCKQSSYGFRIRQWEVCVEALAAVLDTTEQGEDRGRKVEGS